MLVINPKRLIGAMAIIGLFLQSGCLVIENKYETIAPGLWRGALTLEAGAPAVEADVLGEAIRTPEDEPVLMPFLFEVSYNDENQVQIEILNGEERIPVDRILFGRDPATAKDTFVFYFDVMDSYLHGVIKADIMDGEWVRANRDNYRIPFVAHFGESTRFPPAVTLPSVDFTGRWDAQFAAETNKPFSAVGIFDQQGNKLSGTFLTETGDYRYLAGDVTGNTLRLSAFDGSHAFLFDGKMQPDSTILGTYWSGHRYKVLWSAQRNDNARLHEPDSITVLNEGFETIDFTFPDATGKSVGLNDPEFAGHPKIVQILGTWCPNCRDETNFLVDYLKSHPDLDIKVIALAFESYSDDTKNQAIIKKYIEKMQIPYPVLLAGHYDYGEIAQKLPMLKKFVAFPTMIMLDKDNRVIRIHTGFSGPATPDYQAFATNFDHFIKELAKS